MRADNVSMQGGGYYNENSNLQGLAIEKSLDLISYSEHESLSITLADYGCSEGKNSVRLFSKYLARLPPVSSATLVFNDTPSNDFSSLTSTINQNWDGLSQNGKLSIHPLLSPRSYFEQIVPDGFVDAGFNFTALHWLRMMPDASSTPSTLSAAAHDDFIAFLSVRHREFRPKGTLTLCIPSHGDISVQPVVKCFETAIRILYDKYQVDPSIAWRLPMHFRTSDEIQASIAAVESKWRLKNHQTVPLMHTSWSPEVVEAHSEEDKMAARKRYAHGVAGFGLAACSQFFIDDLKSQSQAEASSGEDNIRTKDEFMKNFKSTFEEQFLKDHCLDKVGFTYTLLELERV
ncbi:benzoate carboxyl methyltransferase [Fusarium beomiforme]|uniref:Benzoate carboxyl methyltransferase n=1 Tax=Fusarium beomiforme TaxID=44412 RepID=A0A9P5AKS1_9HYPO|nr:benzoate carboxyl methyltransferase [Fusarium beomiforme]